MITVELAQRKQDGLEVKLLWDGCSTDVWIELVDERAETSLVFGVDPKSALDAFYHPYAFAPEPAVELAEAAVPSHGLPAIERRRQ